jgi:hypothetical protein
MLMEKLLGFLHGHALAHRDEMLLGHQLADRLTGIFREAHVTIGENADQFAGLAVAFDHGNPGNMMALHQRERIGEAGARPDGQRVYHHPRFEFLHAADLVGLLFGREIAVNDTHTTGLGHCDGQGSLGNGVHGGGNQRDAELDGAGKTGSRIDLARQHGRSGGNQQNVVERQRFAYRQRGALFRGQGLSFSKNLSKGDPTGLCSAAQRFAAPPPAVGRPAPRCA